MRHPDHRHGTGPRGRTSPARPPQRHRGGASPSSTGPAPSRPGSRPAGTATGRARASGTPTPATVWACGTPPSDPDTRWPAPVVEKIVTSFTAPGGRVVLLTWPIPAPNTQPDHDPAPHPRDKPGREPRAALTTVRGLGRTALVIEIAPETDTRPPASRPYWADLVSGTQRVGTTMFTHGWPAPTPSGLGAIPPDADLVLTNLRPGHPGDRASDQIAGLAARLLRTGGILAVLTCCDWSRGRLIDPTGAVVAAAQNTDLLYLQHIVVLHAPVRDTQFVIEPELADPDERQREWRRAHGPGMPTPHRRIHTDLLVFAQPHDHDSPSPAPVTDQTRPL